MTNTTQISRNGFLFLRMDDRKEVSFLGSRKVLLFSPESNLIVDKTDLLLFFINFPFETVPAAFISVYTSSSVQPHLFFLFFCVFLILYSFQLLILYLLLLLPFLLTIFLLFDLSSTVRPPPLPPPLLSLQFSSVAHHGLGMNVESPDVFPLRELLPFYGRRFE